MIKLDENKTCFENCKLAQVSCKNKTCRSFVENDKTQNCILLSVSTGDSSLTLQEIGDVFGLTRMRICQIEQAALKKIKKKTNR